MTETTTRDAAKDTIAISRATMAHDLVAALLAELRGMPEHWAKLNADLQQKILERIKEKTLNAVETACTLLMRSEFQAVPAKLEYVNRKDGIRAGITVAGDANCRHALFDAAGSQVLVVLADPKRWAARMDEIKAKDDQLELFNTDANYDPAVDQPGYRRDQDPLAPGKTWADLKKSFGVGDGTKPPEGGTLPPFEALLPDGAPRCQCGVEKTDIQCGLPREHEGPHTLTQFGPVDSNLPEDQAHLVAQRILQEQLAEAGVAVSLGAIQAASQDEFKAAAAWVETYLIDGNACTIERPAWLPAPSDGAS